MGGKPSLRGLRITVGTVLPMLRDHTPDEILATYPELERHAVRSCREDEASAF
jgi:uncharacterized protein (DUF433 family)